MRIEEWVEREQVGKLRDMKKRRDKARHTAALASLRQAAMDGANVMPALVEAAEALATVGEMMETLKSVYGPYDGGPEM